MKSLEELERELEEYDEIEPHEFRSSAWKFRFISKLLIEILREVRDR